jgi:ribosomal protein S12 methylthiotransferase
MIKIYIESLGCGKNDIDAELMASSLINKKFKPVGDPEEADIIIINTCGFIESAKKESLDYVFEYVSLKEKYKNKKIIISGCLSQRYPKEIFSQIEEADAVLGVYAYNEIYDVIERLYSSKKRILNVKKPEIIFNSELKRVPFERISAEVKIADGCNKKCGFCAIPFIRGNYKSKRMNDITEEVSFLVDTGVKEILIVAQETTKYGVDIYSRYALKELLLKLNEIENLSWIRLMYADIFDVDEELLDIIKNSKKIVNYLDIPVQNASEKVLKRMRRRGSFNEFEEKISFIREKIPDICIRSTMITGYPGETDKDFEQNLEFIKKIKFDRLGVFPYSDEDGTYAFELEGKLSDETINERFEVLMSTQQKISALRNEDFVGKNIKVLIEGLEDDIYIGRSYRDAPEIDGLVFVKSENELKPGDFVNVKIIGASEYDLEGVVDEF